MKLFLSFLTVMTQKQKDFLGNCTGWTQHTGDNNLIITGGMVNNVEYLDHIQYGNKLDNKYNNFVNPFYLFPLMTDDGKKFFIDYYNDEIATLKNMAAGKKGAAKNNFIKAEEEESELENFWRGHGV